MYVMDASTMQTNNQAPKQECVCGCFTVVVRGKEAKKIGCGGGFFVDEEMMMRLKATSLGTEMNTNPKKYLRRVVTSRRSFVRIMLIHYLVEEDLIHIN